MPSWQRHSGTSKANQAAGDRAYLIRWRKNLLREVGHRESTARTDPLVALCSHYGASTKRIGALLPRCRGGRNSALNTIRETKGCYMIEGRPSVVLCS